MHKKALYRHKRTSDLFAIETDEAGNVVSTSGPLLTKDLNPESLQALSGLLFGLDNLRIAFRGVVKLFCGKLA